MTTLVTGATGTIGHHIVEIIAGQGEKVRALTRNPDTAQFTEGVEVAKGDLSDLDSVEAALAGVDKLHLITFTGPEQAPLENAPQILHLARQAGVQHITVLQGGYEGPVEDAVRASGIPWTQIQPVEFMSNTLEWAQDIKSEGIVREGFPEVRSALVHERDVAAVAAGALLGSGHEGKTYTVTGPEALTHQERVEIIGAATGKDLTYVPLSTEEVVAQWREQGYSEEDIEFFHNMRVNPPEVSYTVQDTVNRVAGRPPLTLRDWADENKRAFT